MILGVTPEEFTRQYSSSEFDYGQLCSTFKKYCETLIFHSPSIPSMALEFSSKMLFKLGPYMRNEKKSKGDKAIRFRFPYTKDVDGKTGLRIKLVIVSTFKDTIYLKPEEDNKMI